MRGGEEGRRAGGLIKEMEGAKSTWKCQSKGGDWLDFLRERERERACKKSLERKWWDLDV